MCTQCPKITSRTTDRLTRVIIVSRFLVVLCVLNVRKSPPTTPAHTSTTHSHLPSLNRFVRPIRPLYVILRASSSPDYDPFDRAIASVSFLARRPWGGDERRIITRASSTSHATERSRASRDRVIAQSASLRENDERVREGTSRERDDRERARGFTRATSRDRVCARLARTNDG